ncbi:hypothetical protein E3N88_37068 [Mikania micrantha]|uniref:DUF4704 domain-containing protein n=1 Tax=Mikania micrantha TaxID=192012 RepID=A0A5N6M637_9ASTR|nr:hypothetical protein E3N88_37068 [Mikania micrantha]
MCCSVGLLGVLLQSAEKIFLNDADSSQQLHWDGTSLCYCIQYLAGHSLSVLSLEKAMGSKESEGPMSSFEFDGESSGLLGPGESRWPFQNGYAFATWIYIESFADTLNAATAAAAIAAATAAKSGKSSAVSAAAAASALAGEGMAHMPRLFSFLSADNQGMEAYFHAQFLVVESGSGKGRKASLHFTHAFKPQCWYFVGLEHTSRQGLPGLQRRRRQCPLFAEMGPIYIFKEPIGPERMAKLASRGGDALPSFGNAAGSPWLATFSHVQSFSEDSARLDAEIAGSLHLLYHPSLLSGRLCPDASPSGAADPSAENDEAVKSLGSKPNGGDLLENLNSDVSLDMNVLSNEPQTPTGANIIGRRASVSESQFKKILGDEGLNFYDSQHRFEHSQRLLVLLSSLPYAPKSFQCRALQDLLILACSHSENRSRLTKMDEWPEWILEILISNYEACEKNTSMSSSFRDVEDLIHNFLIIMLEHSMRQKDGWKRPMLCLDAFG